MNRTQSILTATVFAAGMALWFSAPAAAGQSGPNPYGATNTDKHSELHGTNCNCDAPMSGPQQAAAQQALAPNAAPGHNPYGDTNTDKHSELHGTNCDCGPPTLTRTAQQRAK